MDTEIIVLNLTELQLLSRRGGRISPDQKLTVKRIRQETPASILAHFDEMLARGRKGVAEVRHGVCSGCYLRLPTYLLTGSGGELATCETCGAYLAFVHEESHAGLATASV